MILYNLVQRSNHNKNGRFSNNNILKVLNVFKYFILIIFYYGILHLCFELFSIVD